MNRWFSLYLDVLRLMAASFVVYAHFNVRFLYPEKLPLAEHAHSAVTVFFVLSGFVVAFVVDQRENNPISYTSSRAARILSLSVLAVFLAPCLDIIGRAAAPQIYAGLIPSDYPAVRVLASLGFLAEIWTVSIMTFSNLPYWSLNYEVWYYVLFGIYCFCKPPRRWVIIGIVCLLLGPKIVLMAPCWLAGVLAYRCRNLTNRLSSAQAATLWILSLAAFWGYHHFNLMRAFSEGVILAHGGQWLYTQLYYSRYFGADWLLSAIIVANFMAARRLADCLPELNQKALSWLSYAGGLTYALYIIHFPFVYMWGALLYAYPPSIAKTLVALVLVLSSVALAAVVGEWLRPRIRKWFEQELNSERFDRWRSRWVAKNA